jgi:hypothetical protein
MVSGMTDSIATDDVIARLRASAEGSYATEASVELVVRSFLLAKLMKFIHLDADGLSAAIDWDSAYDAMRAGTIGMSRGESRLMDVAASLGSGYPISLMDLDSMDATNATLVLQAIVHSLGWHMGQAPASITGFDPGR